MTCWAAGLNINPFYFWLASDILKMVWLLKPQSWPSGGVMPKFVPWLFILISWSSSSLRLSPNLFYGELLFCWLIFEGAWSIFEETEPGAFPLPTDIFTVVFIWASWFGRAEMSELPAPIDDCTFSFISRLCLAGDGVWFGWSYWFICLLLLSTSNYLVSPNSLGMFELTAPLASKFGD